MKKYLSFILCGVLAFTLIACKKSPEAQSKAIFKESAELSATTMKKMTEAQNGKDAAEALTEFAKEMDSISKNIEKLKKDYPKFDIENDPSVAKERDEAKKSMEGAVGIILAAAFKFADDKDFKDAMEKLKQSPL